MWLQSNFQELSPYRVRTDFLIQNSRLFPKQHYIFPDSGLTNRWSIETLENTAGNSRLYFYLKTFSMSGKLLGKFEDFFKNSKLCTSPGPIFPTVIVLLTAVPGLVTQRSSRKEFWEKRCVRRDVLRLATQRFSPKDLGKKCYVTRRKTAAWRTLLAMPKMVLRALFFNTYGILGTQCPDHLGSQHRYF